MLELDLLAVIHQVNEALLLLNWRFVNGIRVGKFAEDVFFPLGINRCKRDHDLILKRGGGGGAVAVGRQHVGDALALP